MSLMVFLSGWLLAAPAFAGGSGEWLAEFNESCARTAETMELSREELLALIARCERVKRSIETQDEAVRKVYLKRVQMCLDLFRYALDSRAAEGKGHLTAAPGEKTEPGPGTPR